MSRVSNLLRGITNDPLKQAVRKVLSSGFELGPMTGTTHCSVIWPETGEKVGFGTTVSDRNYSKTFLRNCEAASGLVLVERHKTGKSRQKTLKHGDGYIHTKVPISQTEASERLAQLTEKYIDRALEFRVLTMRNTEPTHSEISRMVSLLKQLSKMQDVFVMLKQPLPDIDVPVVQRFKEEK